MSNIVGGLESALVDAALSLELFEASQTELLSTLRNIREDSGFSIRLHRLPFIHARSFIHAIHEVQKLTTVLDQLVGDSPDIKTASNDLASRIPDLKQVRDSEQHLEDRLQGTARGRKLPTAQLWIGNLVNNQYQMTMNNGRVGSVEISGATLDVAASCIQRVIDALEWTGRPYTTYKD